MSYFFVLNKLHFCPYCRGESLSYVREKCLSLSFNYCYKRMSRKQITHILRYFNNFSMILFNYTHLFPTTPIIKKKKKYWVFHYLKINWINFLSIFSIDVPVFFSYAINCILPNIVKFLKWIFSQWDGKIPLW